MTHNPSLVTVTSAAHPVFAEIQTPRLDLIAVTPESLHIQQRNTLNMRGELGACIHAIVPEEWPHENWEPHVFDYLLKLFAESPEAIGWCRYLVVRHPGPGTILAGRTLIGTFG